MPHAAVAPNNTATDTFDVVINAADSAAEFSSAGDVSIRDLTLNSRAQNVSITGISGVSSLTVQGAFHWMAGTITLRPFKALGEVAVSTTTPVDRFLGEISFGGHTIVKSGAALRIAEGSIARNESGAVIEFEDGASLVIGDGRRIDFSQGDGNPVDFENFGTFRLLPGLTPFETIGQVTLANFANVEFPAKTVSFVHGIKQMTGALLLNATHLQSPQGDLSIDGGSLLGSGQIAVNVIQIGGIAKGTFDAQQSLGCFFYAGSTLELELRGLNDYDRFTTSDLQLEGNLKVDLSSTFQPSIQPSDTFKIITAGQINGSFGNIAFGQLLQLSGDSGTMLASHIDSAPQSVVLSDYGPNPLQMNFSQDPLLFSLSSHGNLALLDPAATLVAVNSLSWANALLQVRITQGFQADQDSLGFSFHFHTSSAPPGSIALIPSDGGDPIVLAAITFAPDEINITFNSNAAAQNVQDILRAIGYANSQFRPDWFELWDDKEPLRQIQVRLLTAVGDRAATKQIDFPFLEGIRSELAVSSLCIGGGGTITMIGSFSDQTEASVPNLETTFTSTPSTLAVSRMPTAHGTAQLMFNDPGVASYIGRITATAGDFSAKAEFNIINCNGVSASFDVAASLCLLTFACWVNPCQCDGTMDQPFECIQSASATSPMSLISATSSPTPRLSLALFRAVRSLLNQTPEGIELVQLYEKHSSEVARMFSGHPEVLASSFKLFIDFSPGLSALLQGRGNTVQITSSLISELSNVWTQVENLGSAELRKDMESQQARFFNFTAFTDKDFTQWANLIQVPAPTQPLLYVSASGMRDGVFFAQANDVPGLAFSLWRSPEIGPPAWVRVDSARITRNGFTATLSDMDAPPQRVFYQVRAE